MMTKLFAALIKAQAEMTGAKKDSSNPFFKSKYADLKSVDAAIGPALEKHGLGYVQISHNLPDVAAIETVIIHESGETFSCGVVAVPVSKADAQGYGSAMTYSRRYSLSAAFGVCPEDDDGNAASKAKPTESAPAVPRPSPELLKSANEAAQAGTVAYSAFWKEISSIDRNAIGQTRHADFKLVAQEVK